jgi:type VI secretion system protein ImpL
LDQVNNSPAEQKEAAKQQCMNSASTAQQAARQIGQGFKIDQEAHVDETVQNLLLAPITWVSAVLRPGPVSGAGLCAQMSPLAAKFPFNPKATVDASPQELAAFFDPASGALSQFYNASLKNLLLPQGVEYVANTSGSQQVNPAFLSFFNRATGLARALYTGGPGQIQFKYALRPHPTESVGSLSMNIDGQTMTYSGGNAPFKQFTWPGATAQGVKLTVKISGGSELGFPSYDGTWGVFHYFADADKWQQTGTTYNIEWVLRVAGGRPVTAPSGKPVTVQFDLDTLGAPPILQKGYLSNLSCVSTVAK